MSEWDWAELCKIVTHEYVKNLEAAMDVGRTFTYTLLHELRREERRRDPYERLTSWMKTLPDWHDSTCRCYECH